MEDSGKSINNIASKSTSKLLNPWMLHFQKLALELKCPLCLRLFKNPVLLPCNHLFCSSCMSDSSTIGSECALCNTKYAQIDLRHVPFVENMVTIYKNLDATFCANAFQQRSSDDMMVLERCQTLQNSICSNKNTDKVMLNSCMSNEVGAANRIVEKSDSMRCSQKDIGDRVEMDLNQATESAPDSPPFCDKGSDNCCSYQDSEQPPNVVKSEYSSLKSTTTGKSDLKERMAQFRSESSASENEGLRRDTKKHKNLPNGDAIIQQSTSYHNKLVDSRCDLDLKSEKVPGAIISSNSPNDSCPSTSMCSFCQSFDISEATGPMLHYEEGILVTGDAAMQPNVVHVHKVCIDWAPQVYFVGETVKNLKKEVARGAKLKCTLCGLKGAALGCFVKSCKRTYHVPCAMNISTCRWDHVNYLLLCPSHSNVKFPSENSSHKKKSTQKHPVSSQLPLQQPNNLLGGLRNDDKKIVFCGSALSNEEKVLLINFASKVGATVTKCWTSNVTHVVAATDANGACSRTMKVLRVILNGQWILKVDWIRACMEETNLVDEECYEIDLILEDALDGGQVATFSAIEIITGLVKLLHSVNGSKWQNTFLGLWTAALGFESFLVMRHGAGPFSSAGDLSAETASSSSADLRLNDTNGKHRLGCYFCNDVVAPTDSTSNRTLNQQCTVTRPGLAPIASALAVELLVGILHHPQGIFAEADINNSVSGGTENPLGILPHQIRGSLSQFSQMSLIGHSSSSCTACCQTVISEYRNRGMEFILEAINHPTYLEDVTGLTELMRSATKFSLETDNEDEFCWLSSSHGTEGPLAMP